MADNIAVKDANTVTQTVRSTDTAGVHVPHHNIDKAGIARSTNPTPATDGAAVAQYHDLKGRQIAVIGNPRELTNHQTTQIVNSIAETTIITAGGAGVFNDLSMLIITNESATALTVTIKDATAGTTRMVIAIAANGGAVIPFPRPVKQAAANNAWTATLSVNTVTVDIFALYDIN